MIVNEINMTDYDKNNVRDAFQLKQTIRPQWITCIFFDTNHETFLGLIFSKFRDLI